MCGIAGFVEPHGQGAGRWRGSARAGCSRCAMSSVTAGQTTRGCSSADGAALGMRRLSIIDLAGGHQPIRNEDGSHLGGLQRRDLQLPRAARGARQRAGTRSTRTPTPRRSSTPTSNGARTRSRTSAGCSASPCGIDAAGRCSSPATASGIKPLHYAEHNGALSFGSEIKSLLVGGRAERSLDPAALEHYLSFLYTPRDTSIFTRHPQAASGPSPALAGRPRGGQALLGSAGAGIVHRFDGRGRRGPDDASSPTPCSRTSSATCRLARCCPAASTRAWSSG